MLSLSTLTRLTTGVRIVNTNAKLFTNGVNKMMTPQQIRDALKDRNVQAVAAASGVSAHSIYRLIKEEGRPLYTTVKALSDYLERP